MRRVLDSSHTLGMPNPFSKGKVQCMNHPTTPNLDFRAHSYFAYPCCPALTLLRPEHELYLLYISYHAETWLWHNREQLRKHDCKLTDCFVAYFVLFRLWKASRIHGFLDYARQCNMHDYASYPRCAPVLVHEQPYHAIAHLFQPCQGQESVPHLNTVQSTHTGQTNWTLGVRRT